MKKQILIPAVLFVIITIAYINTREWVWLALMALYVIVFGLNYFANKGSQLPLVLLGLHLGPRTDTKYMTKQDLYKSGIKLLVWAAYIFPFFIPIRYLPQTGSKKYEYLVMAFLFALSIICMMCLGGGIYLIFRGLFRKKDYIPPENMDRIKEGPVSLGPGEFFNQLRSLDTSSLPEYLKILLGEINPILERIDPDKISDKSKVEIVTNKKESYLAIDVEPKDERIQGLHLYGFKSSLDLDFAGGIQLEDHDTSSDINSLVSAVKTSVENYLQGTTMIESLNKKGKLVKREYYFGIDTENDKSKLAGTSYHRFFNKIVNTNKLTYKFLK